MIEDCLTEKLGEDCQRYYEDVTALVKTDEGVKAVLKKLPLEVRITTQLMMCEWLAQSWVEGERDAMKTANEFIETIKQAYEESRT